MTCTSLLPVVDMSSASFLGTKCSNFRRHDTIHFQDCVHLLRFPGCLSVRLLEFIIVLYCVMLMYVHILSKFRVFDAAHLLVWYISWAYDMLYKFSVCDYNSTTKFEDIVRHLCCIYCMSLCRLINFTSKLYNDIVTVNLNFCYFVLDHDTWSVM